MFQYLSAIMDSALTAAVCKYAGLFVPIMVVWWTLQWWKQHEVCCRRLPFNRNAVLFGGCYE